MAVMELQCMQGRRGVLEDTGSRESLGPALCILLTHPLEVELTPRCLHAFACTNVISLCARASASHVSYSLSRDRAGCFAVGMA